MNSTDYPFVSVIIPAYNEEKLLGRALTAVMAQDYPHYEIVVVDNNSSDRTYEIAQNFPATVPVIVVQEKRQGVMFAREAGRLAAHGDIVALLDSDCVPKPNWISCAIEKFDSPDVVAVAGLYHYYDAPLPVKIFTWTSLVLLPITNALTQYAKLGAVMLGGNSFIRRSALESIGGFDTRYQFYGDDAQLATALSKVGWVKTVSNITVATSARRYAAQGFFATQKKYTSWIVAHIFSKKKSFDDSIEHIHPR